MMSCGGETFEKNATLVDGKNVILEMKKGNHNVSEKGIIEENM